MGSCKRTIVVLGPDGAGKATTTGCMLFKYGAIDMGTMEKFQRDGIQTYNQVAIELNSEGIAPVFHTPKHHVTIIDATSGKADCAILVLSADSPSIEEILKDYFDAASTLIILINKMDKIKWSEEQFLKIVGKLSDRVKNVPIIPISALYGDNMVESSKNSEWFNGFTHGGKTVLEALESSFQR